MKSCMTEFFVVCVFLMTIFTAASHSAVPSVKVKRHSSATLPCSFRCSGSVTWKTVQRPGDSLGHCGSEHASCWLQEGYQMSHEKYQTGNLSLTITDADFRNRGLYTCQCDGKEVCSVQLLIEVLNTSLRLNSDESLVLDLEIPEEVEVIYNSTGADGPFSGQICTVDGRSLRCKPEYKQRVSTALKLRAVTPSDSGVYTVMDKRNEEVIHTYAVIVESAGGSDKVKDDQPDHCPDKGAGEPMWPLIIPLAVIMGFLVSVIFWQIRKIKQLQMKIALNATVDKGREGAPGAEYTEEPLRQQQEMVDRPPGQWTGAL